jgi:hypothetical protein
VRRAPCLLDMEGRIAVREIFMPAAWVPMTVVVAAAIAAGLYLLTRRPQPVVFANPRAKLLASRLARAVGCSLSQALPVIRQELEIAPNQSDDTLLKRAAYHYRQELPENSCQIYHDEVPG